MAEPRSLLDTESGLPDDIDVTFTDCHFGYVPDSRNPDRLVFLPTLVYDDDDVDDREQRFGCGKDWFTEDRGKSATNPGGPNKRFNNSTGIGVLLNSLVAADGQAANNRLKEVPGGPFVAEFWEGLRAHIVLEEVKTKIDGEDVEFNRIKITEVHGWDPVGGKGPSKTAGASKKSTGAASKSKAKVDEPAPEPETTDPTAGIDPDIIAKLKEVFDNPEVKEFDDFKELAILEVAEVTSDPAVRALLDDSETGSLWDTWLEG